MYVSLHHYVFLYLTFIYFSIPSSLLAEGTASTCKICFTMIGRAGIKGSKTNVAMNACGATQPWLSLWVMGGLGSDREGGYQDAPLNSSFKVGTRTQL